MRVIFLVKPSSRTNLLFPDENNGTADKINGIEFSSQNDTSRGFSNCNGHIFSLLWAYVNIVMLSSIFLAVVTRFHDY